MGIWRIELIEGEEPRMYVDDTMKILLGIDGQERTPEKTYTDRFLTEPYWMLTVVEQATPVALMKENLLFLVKREKGFIEPKVLFIVLA